MLISSREFRSFSTYAVSGFFLNVPGLKDINDIDGAWEADHIIQKGKGGEKEIINCLPSCVKCNRLRWHRKGDNLRDLIFLGLIANDEIKKGTDIGKKIFDLKHKRIEINKNRKRNVR